MTDQEIEVMIQDCMGAGWVWESKMDYTLSLCLARAVARKMQERCVKITESYGRCPVQSDRDEGFNAACELVAKVIRG